MKPFNLKGEHPKIRQKYHVKKAVVYDEDGKSVEINFGGDAIFEIRKLSLRSELVAFCNRQYKKRHFVRARLEAEWCKTYFSKKSYEMVCKIAYRYCSMEFFVNDVIRFPLYYTNKELESTDNWRDGNIILYENNPLFRQQLWDKVDLRNIEIAGILASWVNIGSDKAAKMRACAELYSYIGDDPIGFVTAKKYNYLRLNQCDRFFDDYAYGDLIYLFERIRFIYEKNQSLEQALLKRYLSSGEDLADSLISLFEGCEGFRRITSCRKRMNTFLRWMVLGWRVDLGVWKRFKPSLLKPSVGMDEFITARKLRLVDGKLSLDYPERVADIAKRLFPECPAFLDYALIGHRMSKTRKGKYKFRKLSKLPQKDIHRTLVRVSRGKSRGTKYKYDEF